MKVCSLTNLLTNSPIKGNYLTNSAIELLLLIFDFLQNFTEDRSLSGDYKYFKSSFKKFVKAHSLTSLLTNSPFTVNKILFVKRKEVIDFT